MYGNRGGDYCEVGCIVFESLYSLGGGMIKKPQPHMWISLAESLQFFQKDKPQGIFAGAYSHKTVFQFTVLADLSLTYSKLFTCDGNVLIKLPALRSEDNALVGAEKQGTFQFLLQIVHASCHVGLVVVEDPGSFCEAFVLGHIVKDLVIVIRYHGEISCICHNDMITILIIRFTFYYDETIIHTGKKINDRE